MGSRRTLYRLKGLSVVINGQLVTYPLLALSGSMPGLLERADSMKMQRARERLAEVRTQTHKEGGRRNQSRGGLTMAEWGRKAYSKACRAGRWCERGGDLHVGAVPGRDADAGVRVELDKPLSLSQRLGI
jgi:hypothetical protein